MGCRDCGKPLMDEVHDENGHSFKPDPNERAAWYQCPRCRHWLKAVDKDKHQCAPRTRGRAQLNFCEGSKSAQITKGNQ